MPPNSWFLLLDILPWNAVYVHYYWTIFSHTGILSSRDLQNHFHDSIIFIYLSKSLDNGLQFCKVNCTFFCKFFSTTTLEIWQLLLQTYIVKLSGFLRRSRNSFSFFSRSPINPNRKRSQGRRAQACLYAVSDPDYPWLREVKDSITPFHAAKGFLFCTSLSSAWIRAGIHSFYFCLTGKDHYG